MKFIITAPQYTSKSVGVMALHDLCESLNNNGHTAAIIFFHNGSASEQNFEFAISNNPNHHKPNSNYYNFSTDYFGEVSDFLVNGVIIYPDLITGNPLNAKRTVRYVLNRNESNFTNDYILAFSKEFHQLPNYTLFRVIDIPFIHEKNSLNWRNRTLNATYIGKGSAFGACERIKNSILIERDWPRDKEQLGILLRQVKYFYTWDNVSGTNYDAVLCGCVPVFLSSYFCDKSLVDKMEPGKFPDISLYDSESEALIELNSNAITNSLTDMKNEMALLLASWEKKVQGFAVSCESYFG